MKEQGKKRGERKRRERKRERKENERKRRDGEKVGKREARKRRPKPSALQYNNCEASFIRALPSTKSLSSGAVG